MNIDKPLDVPISILMMAVIFAVILMGCASDYSLNHWENHQSNQHIKQLEQTQSTHSNLELSTLINKSQIFVAGSHERMTFDEFVTYLADKDYLILGEYHNNATQHQLALALLQALHGQRKQGSLLLEMLRIDQQPLIDKIQQNPQMLNHQSLKTALNWQNSWDWSIYGDLVKHPFIHNYNLIATNLTNDEVQILMQGAYPIKGNKSTSSHIQNTIKEHILANHSIRSSKALSQTQQQIVDHMVQVQQFRDRRMAEKLLSAKQPAFLLTGNLHADKHIGVPIHVLDITEKMPNKPNGAVIVMVNELTEADSKEADFIWVIND